MFFFKGSQKNLRYICLVYISCAFAQSKALADKQIRVLTGPLPPYSYETDQKPTGLVTEVFLELSKQLSKDMKINIRPWPRAIKEAKDTGTIIYPFARTEYRENNYLWLGPISEAYHVMVVPSSDLRTYNSLSDFKELNIGVLRNAPPNKILKQQNFQHLTPLGVSSSIAKMLKVNRIEAWYDAKVFIEYHLLRNNIKADNFRVAFVDKKMSFYIGFSKDLKDEFPLWEKAFDKMKKNGKLRAIQKKYELKILN